MRCYTYIDRCLCNILYSPDKQIISSRHKTLYPKQPFQSSSSTSFIQIWITKRASSLYSVSNEARKEALPIRDVHCKKYNTLRKQEVVYATLRDKINISHDSGILMCRGDSEIVDAQATESGGWVRHVLFRGCELRTGVRLLSWWLFFSHELEGRGIGFWVQYKKLRRLAKWYGYL